MYALTTMTVETTEYALTERIGVRVSPIQKATLERIARGRGCSISDLARQAVIELFSLPTEGSGTTTMVERSNMPSVTEVPPTASSDGDGVNGKEPAQVSAE